VSFSIASPRRWSIAVLSTLIAVGVACQRGEAPPNPEAPPPTGSAESVPPDPQLVQLTEQIVVYKLRVDKDPKDVEALAGMGNANYALRRFDHAQVWFERALKIDPNRHATRMDLALALRNMGKSDEAITELKRVLTKEPKNAAALYNLGVILLEDKNDQKGAIARWEALMNAHPEYPHTAQLRQLVEEIKHPSSAPPSPPPGG
jgi:cytochrome c-type biogenesis protein CcmH/NrfG